MNRVMVESPFAGDWGGNYEYMQECLKDSIQRGEAPFAMHALYPLVLCDYDVEERNRGIACGLAWLSVCNLVAVYADRGISPGMQVAIEKAHSLSIPIEYRSIKRPEGG